MSSAAAHVSGGSRPRLTPQQRGVLVAGWGANGLFFLDQTAVAVALHAIGQDLDASNTELHLVIGAYLVVLAAVMPIAARLADVHGRRRVFLAGVTVSGLAALASTVVPTIELLIVLRILQGAGAALSVPLALANVTAVLPAARRAWAIGALATGGTAFLVVGPVLGGAVVSQASWRWVFALYLPLVVVALRAAGRWLPEARKAHPPRLDTIGLLLLTAGLAVLVTGLLDLGDRGPSVTGGALVAAGLALLLTFTWAERRRTSPLVDLRMLGRGPVTGYLAALFGMQFAVLAVTVELVLYLQRSLGYGALAAGLLMLPTLFGTPLFSTATGRIADRRGSRGLVLGGLVLGGVALGWIAVAAGAERIGWLLPAFVLFGLSRPLVLTPATAGPMRALPPDERSLASVLATEARQLGAVLGVAVSGLLVGGVGADAGFTAGFQVAMGVSAVVCLAAAAVVWVVTRAQSAGT